MARYVTVVGLILFAVFSRLLPHPPNVTPVTAIALLGAVHLDRRLALILPLAAMFLSDIFIGLHSLMIWVYASVTVIVVVGMYLRKHRGPIHLLAASLTGSVLFFVITNFGVWVSGFLGYPISAVGLMECYAAGLPFLRNMVIGDLFYVGLLFGAFELAKRYVPSLRSGETISPN